MEERRVRGELADLIREGGLAGLRLADKPELQAAMARFAADEVRA